MKKQIVTILGMTVFGLPVLAAADFSGTWVRNGAKSDPVPNTMYWLTRSTDTGGGAAGSRGGRGGNAGGGRGAGQTVMTVQQDSNSLRVTEGQGATRIYTLDGKPFTRPMDTRMAKATVKAKADGDTLVILTTEPYGGMPGNATLEVLDVWSLSPDAKTLTITTTRDVPALQKTYRQVYDRR